MKHTTDTLFVINGVQVDSTRTIRSLVELDPWISCPLALTDRVYAMLKYRILSFPCVPTPG